MIGRKTRASMRRYRSLTWGEKEPLLDHADEADRVIAEMLRQAELAGPEAYARVRAAVPDEWMRAYLTGEAP